MDASVADPRRKWMGALAVLVSPSFPVQATDALMAFLPFLDDIPEGAFTKRSLEAVCAHQRRQAVPSLDELRIPLLAWWRDNEPPMRRISGPGGDLSAMDRAWLTYWQTRRNEGFAPFKDSPGGRAHVASLVRERSAKAWDVIQRGLA